MLRTVPIMGLVPLFIVWFGLGEVPKIILIAFATFFQVYIQMFAGIRNIDRKLIEVGRMYELSRTQMLRRIIIPGALPSILQGIRLGLGMAWLALVIAELTGANSGVGYWMQMGREYMRVDIVLAALLIFAGVGKAVDSLVRLMERKFLSWRDNNGTGSKLPSLSGYPSSCAQDPSGLRQTGNVGAHTETRHPHHNSRNCGDHHRNGHHVERHGQVPALGEVGVEKRVRVPVLVAGNLIGRERAAGEGVDHPNDGEREHRPDGRPPEPTASGREHPVQEGGQRDDDVEHLVGPGQRAALRQFDPQRWHPDGPWRLGGAPRKG
ncbi:hypothetical protein GCM10028820_13520 [Tessaracoccus terricola]